MSLLKDRKVLEAAYTALERHKDVGWDDAGMAHRAIGRMVTLLAHWEQQQPAQAQAPEDAYQEPPYHAPHLDEPCNGCGWGEGAQLLTRLDQWIPTKRDDLIKAESIIHQQLAAWEVDQAAQHHREITREDPGL